MAQYVEECKELGIPYIYDASQQIVRASDRELRDGCTGSRMVILNDYELEMLKNKTGWNEQEIAQSTETLIVTCGDRGSKITHGGRTIDIPIARPRKQGEPTGTGDAYRSGIIKGVMHNFSWEFTGRLGALAATFALEENGAQNHRYTLDEFAERFIQEFGQWEELDKLCP
jgi:adenosine kinase